MSSTSKSFVPPLAARFNSGSARGTDPPPFVPPLAMKLTPPVRPARAEAEFPDRLNLAEAARYLDVSEPTMAKLARNIPHLHMGRIWRFDRAVLGECLRGRQCRVAA